MATGSPTVGLVAAMAVDFTAGVPTYCNAWRRRESALTFGGAWFCALCGIAVLQAHTFATWATPLYELAQNIVLWTVVLMRAPAPAQTPPPVPMLPWYDRETAYDEYVQFTINTRHSLTGANRPCPSTSPTTSTRTVPPLPSCPPWPG